MTDALSADIDLTITAVYTAVPLDQPSDPACADTRRPTMAPDTAPNGDQDRITDSAAVLA